MIVRTVLVTIILILTGICSSPVRAESPTASGDAGIIASFQKELGEAKDAKEAALLGKKLGDYYATQEDYKNAAGEYVKALSASTSPFTGEERLQMAIAISWADRLDDAIRVLRSLLGENPEDWMARIHLARVLSWSDSLYEAEAEADIVLKDHAESQDALLVKANVLRWRGDAKASIPVYEKALSQGENFDARIGLAFAYLDLGEKDTAQETGKTLKPSYPYQKNELAKLSNALCGVRASHLGIQYSHYKDSDDNRVNRSTLSYGFWVGKWETELYYRLTDAKDPTRHTKAADLAMTAHSQAGRVDMSAGAGIGRPGDNAGYLVTGQAKADIRMDWGGIGMSAAREMFSETAQLIENRIVRKSGTLSLFEIVSPRLTFSESYTYSDYSDSNNADDLRIGARYAVTLAPPPKIATGYRFRYWSFRRQSGSGYFDPKGFTSHQVFVSFRAERNGYYAYLEPYTGYQSFTRYDERSGHTFFGISGSAGWTMKKCTSFEINGEGGNYAGGTAAGFNYSLIGFRLILNY